MRESLRPLFATFQDGTLLKWVAVAIYLIFERFVESLRGPNVSMVLLLVIFDLITGVMAALKKNKRISSRFWYKTPLKIGNYCILLSLGRMTADLVLLSWLDHVLLLLIVTTEILSILENVAVIQPRLIPKSVRKKIGILKTDRNH